MKKIIILQHDGGELGNQLWNYVSICAYAIERGYSCENFSFFEYARYFNLSVKSKIINWFFFYPFRKHNKRRSSFSVKWYRFLYKNFIVRTVIFFNKNKIIYSRDGIGGVYFLPPTVVATKKLKEAEHSSETIFFSQTNGGVFRNPAGIQTNKTLIKKHFQPALWVEKNVRALVISFRANFKVLVGVHIRQGDYVLFKNGKFSISQTRTREILEEYCMQKQLSLKEVFFMIASDGAIDKAVFDGLNVEISDFSAGEDMFILASFDVIIGSDSTFGHFAAYYGDIPHIIMKKEPMDWEYYKDKSSYFINKYLTVMLV